MQSGAYTPPGYARQRGLDDYAWHDTGQPEPHPLPIMRAKVIETRQHENTVDVRLTDGTILRHVTLASPHAGTNYGSYRTPRVMNTVDDRDSEGSLDTFEKTGERDHFVLVAFIGGNDQPGMQRPIIFGSVQPQVTHMTNEKIGNIDRIASTDAVQLWTDDEHMAEYAPDGTGVVRGPDPEKWYAFAHDPGIEGPPDFDKKWKVINEDDKKHFYAIYQKSSDVAMMFHPDGRWQVHKGDGNGGTLAALEVHNDGNITIKTAGNHTIDSEVVTITGNLFVNGNISTPNNINGGNIQAPAGGVPGPLGPAGAAGAEGPVVPHDFPMSKTPSNPFTGKRDQPSPPNNQ